MWPPPQLPKLMLMKGASARLRRPHEGVAAGPQDGRTGAVDAQHAGSLCELGEELDRLGDDAVGRADAAVAVVQLEVPPGAVLAANHW